MGERCALMALLLHPRHGGKRTQVRAELGSNGPKRGVAKAKRGYKWGYKSQIQSGISFENQLVAVMVQ